MVLIGLLNGLRTIEFNLFMKGHMYSLLYSLVRGIRCGVIGSKLRCFCLRKLGCTIGQKSYIGPNVTIVNPSRLQIGNNVSIHQDCYIDAVGEIEIGSDVSIAHQVSILTFNHIYSDINIPIKHQGITINKIIISDNVWIGCKAVLLPGVYLKSRTVVAALSICNKVYSGNELIGGIPARQIKRI